MSFSKLLGPSLAALLNRRYCPLAAGHKLRALPYFGDAQHHSAHFIDICIRVRAIS